MISPFTPPGTKIVCVDDADKYSLPGPHYVGDLGGLAKGATYTVYSTGRGPFSKSGFVVFLCEINRPPRECGFDLARFRYLHLPRSLTDLLETAPTRAPSELEPTQ